MIKPDCPLCKIAAAILVIGGLNWGLIGLLDVNVIEKLLGSGLIARVIYDVVGLCALVAIVGLCGGCPSCKK